MTVLSFWPLLALSATSPGQRQTAAPPIRQEGNNETRVVDSESFYPPFFFPSYSIGAAAVAATAVAAAATATVTAAVIVWNRASPTGLSHADRRAPSAASSAGWLVGIRQFIRSLAGY